MISPNEAIRKQEKKQLSIFLLVTFGMPFLMGIPLAILSHAGKDTSYFAATQMLYPAAGLILSKLISEKDKSLLPKTFFTGFLVITGIMILWCFTLFFLPDQIGATGYNFLSFASSVAFAILFLMGDDNEKRSACGLTGKNWRLTILPLVLFVALYFTSLLLVYLGSLPDLFGIISSTPVLTKVSLLPVAFFFSLTDFFGEEYGWRCYFQPLLQQKFGLIKGVLVFGVLWELWHLPLVLFYYAPSASITGFNGAMVQLILMRLVSTTMMAIFMAYAYMKTQNVWLPVMIHFLNNALVTFWSFNETTAVANQELDWISLGIFILIQLALFVPFLFTNVFKKPKAVGDGVKKPALAEENDN